MASVNTLPVTGSPYQVPPEPSPVSSTAMAIAVHAALLGFLWVGVNWQNVEPVAVTAEVWDMKVRDAAPSEPAPVPVRTPPPPPKAVLAPPPAPPKVDEPVASKAPDIALEREKKAKQLREQKLEQKKLADEKAAKEKLEEEQERKEKELADKKAKSEKLAKAAKDAADEKQIKKMRDDQMKRIMGGVAGAGEAAKSTAPKTDAGYAGRIRNRIKRYTTFNGDTNVEGNPMVSFRIEQLPTGEIISVRRTKSSGIPEFDAAVERGINKSSPLDPKNDGTVDRIIDVDFRMKDMD